MVENKFGWKVGDMLTWKSGLSSITREVTKVTKVMVEFEFEGKTIRVKGNSSSISPVQVIPASNSILPTGKPTEPDPAVVNGYQKFWVVVEMTNGNMIDVFVNTPTAIKGVNEIDEVYPWIKEGLGMKYGKDWVRISSVMPGYSLSGSTYNMPIITVV